MGEGRKGGEREKEKEKSSGEDARATGGLVSNLPHPRVIKTKQHTPGWSSPREGSFGRCEKQVHDRPWA